MGSKVDKNFKFFIKILNTVEYIESKIKDTLTWRIDDPII